MGILVGTGIATAVGSIVGSGVGADVSSQASKRAARSQALTNATNLQLARERNANEIALQEAQNKFNLEQWNRNNEYNSPSAQLARYTAAGINPNSAVQGITGTTYNASPVQQTSIPNLTTPQLQSSADQILQGGLNKATIFANMAGSVADVIDKTAKAEKAKAESDTINQTRQQTIELLKSEYKLNDAQAEKAYNEINQIVGQCNQMQKQCEVMAAQIALMDEQTKEQKVKALRASEVINTQLNELVSRSLLSKAQAKYALAVLPSAIGLNVSQAELNHARSELTSHEARVMDSTVKLLGTQTEGQAISNMFEINYGYDQRENGLKLMKEQIKGLGIANSDAAVIIDYLTKIVGSMPLIVK